jgi:signal transduction histidine kinase
MQLNGSYTTGNFIDAIWLVSYGCLGAAALHPSMREVGTHPVERRLMTRRRLVLLAPWAFLAPGLLLVESWLNVRDPHTAEIAVAGIAVLACSLWRTAQILATQTTALALASELQEQKAALLERTMNVGEMERTRVAIELHDGPIQRLASVAYAIDASTARVEVDPGSTRDCLDGLRDRIGAEVDGLRRIMAELRPPVLDHGGLIAALADYLGEFGATHGIATTVVDRLGGARVTSKAEIAVYRVVQEALANVAKHANAHRVEVVVGAADGELTVSVADDGVGFDPAALTKTRDHFGVDAIRERMVNVGGTAELHSRPGAGTTVVATAPLPLANVA